MVHKIGAARAFCRGNNRLHAKERAEKANVISKIGELETEAESGTLTSIEKESLKELNWLSSILSIEE